MMFRGTLKRLGRAIAKGAADQLREEGYLDRVEARLGSLTDTVAAQAGLLSAQKEALSAQAEAISVLTAALEAAAPKPAPEAVLPPDTRLITIEGLPPFPVAVHDVATDAYISYSIKTAGTWETFETELVRRLLPLYDLFLDLGANIGWYSMIAQRAMRPGATVHAFEPDPTNFALLRRNVGQGGPVRVHLVPAAVAEAVGAAALFHSDNNRGDHRLYESDEQRASIAVPITTLDAYFGGRPLPPCLVKMDTQGSEPRIFRGAQAVLTPEDRMSAFVVEFWPYGMSNSKEDIPAFIRLLSRYSQQPHVIDHGAGRLRPIAWAELERRCADDLAPAT